MKTLLPLNILVAIVMLTASVAADSTAPAGPGSQVLFLGQVYCQQLPYCPDFAFWGNTPPGYVELTKPDGTPSNYLWVDFKGQMTFESSPLNVPPPAGLPLVGKLVESGSFQEVDQFFPAGSSRPLFMEGDSRVGLVPRSSTPEPSTLLLAGSGGVLVWFRMRRFRRA